MRRLLTFFFALALVLGTGGAELREMARPEPCGCCESAPAGGPCGCGMPQSSGAQRCGGNTSATALARPAAAPLTARAAGQTRRAEARPCPANRAAFAPRLGLSESFPATAFPSGEDPPRLQGARRPLLGIYRI